MDFDIIPFHDIVWGRRLGAGSFGSVYKGTYLGIDIAIKEVLPSTEYDVRKYFEREWRIMRECRHPNIVLFLGLSKAPEADGRVFIISEYVPRGNLRQYILSSHPFPWRLRLSFATDVARAVAYLHARQCIHRDLKGENLLLTSNERLKVTDFGFARIASRNAEEMRRMTYCGTDGYMSPEIINGNEFDLPTDVFSLGIILIEILSRKLVDSKTYLRTAPAFTPDPEEVRRRASPGCPPALVDLALSCCVELPAKRPVMAVVLAKLREIELEVLARNDEAAEHVGSIRLVNKGGPRAMPSFEPPTAEETSGEEFKEVQEGDGDGDEAVRKMEEDALNTLAGLDVGGGGPSVMGSEDGTWRTARWDEGAFSGMSESSSSDIKGHQRLIPSSTTYSSIASNDTSSSSAYSTDVIRGNQVLPASALKAATPYDEDWGSTVTLRGPADEVVELSVTQGEAAHDEQQGDIPSESDIGTIPSLASGIMHHTGPAQMLQTKKERAREMTLKEKEREGIVGTHRFTLVDKDTVPMINGKKVSAFTSNFAFAFLQKQLAPLTPIVGPGKLCAVCQKKLGQRPALECDDCDVIVHVKCSHAAPRNCDGGAATGV